MEIEIKKVLIIVNLLKIDAQGMVKEIIDYMNLQGIETEVFSFRGIAGPFEVKDADLAIALGGDGTVLFSCRLLFKKSTPILAVNLGRVGFITEVAKEEWQEAFEKYRQGSLGISERLMLEVSVFREERLLCHYFGLNDSVVSSSGISKIIRLHVKLSNTSLGEYRADGVIIATPTGSTAYSAAAGGPILDVDMEALIIAPICPYTLANRPLVVEAGHSVEVEVLSGQRADVLLTVDGQSVFPLKPGDRILFKKAKEKALIIRSDKRNFFEVLRAKLNWLGGTDA